MELALFDVDGTLTTEDTMFSFVRSVVGFPRFVLGMCWLSPMLIAHKLKLIDARSTKERFLLHYLGAVPRSDLDAAAAAFADHIDQVLRPGAMDALKDHKTKGKLFLVSASCEIWLAPWAKRHALPLLCTRVAYQDDRFSGLVGPNCNGTEKVVRVKEMVDLDSFSTVHCYGDSSGDRAMLSIADHATFQPFRGS